MTTFPIVALGEGEAADPQWFEDITNAVNDHETRVDALESQVSTASVTVTDATPRTTTSTSFTATISGSTPEMGVAFTAPTSGKVQIIWTAGMSNGSSPNIAQISPQVRTGSTVNSGTIVLAADAARSTLTTTSSRHAGVYVLTGLTPGNSYNATMLHRSFTAGTSSFDNRELTVVPLIA